MQFVLIPACALLLIAASGLLVVKNDRGWRKVRKLTRKPRHAQPRRWSL